MSLMSNAQGVVTLPIYTLLKGEHAETRTLLNTLKKTPQSMDGTRKKIFVKLRRELLSHAKAEENAVYNQAAERIEKSEVEEARRDHDQIEEILASLENMDENTEAWDDQLKALEQAIEIHVMEEEDVFFEKMKEKFSDEEAKQMAHDFREVKQREMEALA